jgi:hypothetical protein
MNQSEIKEIVKTQFIGNYKPEKLNAVAKVSSKFINKYQANHWISTQNVIDAALQLYSVSTDGGWPHTKFSLYELIEKEKETFFKATY